MSRERTEVVDVGDPVSDTVVVLRHALQRAYAGELTGVVVVLEQKDGGYHAMMTPCENVAERIGRISLVIDDVKAEGMPSVRL